MSMYITKNESASGMKVVLDDMILTKDMPTTAGSKMLDGYVSLFEAEVVTKLTESGFEVAGKANIIAARPTKFFVSISFTFIRF